MVSGKNLLFAMLAVAAAAALPGTAFAEQPDKWVDYVESTGSQWVDTGIIGRWNTKVECKVEWLELGDKSFLASRSGEYGTAHENGRMYFCYCLNANGDMYSAQNTGYQVQRGTLVCRYKLNRVYTYVSEFSATNGEGKVANKVSVDGINNMYSKTGYGCDSGLSLYIFANNQKGNAVSQSKIRCYGLKIWQGPIDGGDMVLVRDYRPCIKNDRAALYDSVSDTIYYSDSGTDLVCDVNCDVPDEFIEYVESQGEAELADGQLSAYIDTGIIGRSGTKMSGEFAILRHEDKGFLGSRDNTKSDSLARFYLLQSFNSKITCGYGKHKDNSKTLELGKKYWVETELDAGSQIEKIGADGVTNTVYSASDSTAIDTGYPMYLFTCNVDGSPTWFAKARCYGFKIWQDNTLVRDYRPCLKNGVAGLYDAVSSNIFYSLGTPFAFDNRRKAPKKKEITFVEYIDSDGNNTLDTWVPARSGLRAAGEMAWLTALSSWNWECNVYLEDVMAVFKRQQRAYLAAIKLTTTERFYMVHAFDSKLDIAHGIHMNGADEAHIYPMTNGASITPVAGEKCSFDVTFKDGELTFDWNGERALTTNMTGSVDTGTSLYLFSSSYWRHRSVTRCYGLKIWEGDTLVRDFKPCLVDGKGMLYDEVTQLLYRPSPDIPASRTGKVVFSGAEKPAQYVEYVESDGSIFVDTGVVGKSGTAADMEMSFLETGDKGFLESRKGNSRYYLFHNGNSKAMYGYSNWYYVPSSLGAGTQTASAGFAVINGQKYHVESLMAAGAQTVRIDGTALLNATDSSNIDTGYNLYLFTCHMDGKPQYSGKGRLYWLKLYQGDSDGSNQTLVRDFKPVKLSNGVVVLWDFVEDKPYLPQSTTTPYDYTTFSAVGPDGTLIRDGLSISIR
ncbi:MAG: hypothetical protein IJG13_15280 [Kiritimatiellae bacterium]|nr:hypothetical protein [Kiritimatiellia bacterium]